MSSSNRPGSSSGSKGGIYQEVGPRGGKHDNFATVADNRRFPPTQRPGSTWKPVKVTPTGKR